MNYRVMRPRVLVVLVLCLATPVPAPVPRCSPLIIINKLVEFASIWSDNNSYFPVPPCEYGGPFKALEAGDFNAVFVLDEPEKVPRHNIYELVWFLKTGLPRIKRMLLGLETPVYDFNILTEGYQHYTPYIRTTQLGHGRKRRPEIIDDPELWGKFVSSQINDLLTNGPDLEPTAYTPVGPIKRRTGQKGSQVIRRPKLGTSQRLGTSPGRSGTSQRTKIVQRRPRTVFRGRKLETQSLGPKPRWSERLRGGDTDAVIFHPVLSRV